MSSDNRSVYGCGEANRSAWGDEIRASSTGRRGRGPLGLEGVHREIADLIRRSERLAAVGDEASLHQAAAGIVERVVAHLGEEQRLVECADAGQRRRLLAGREALLGWATRFAAEPAPETGADLLALLVRQADLEEAAVATCPVVMEKRSGARFATEWAMSPLVASP